MKLHKSINGPAIDIRKILTEVYALRVRAADAGVDGSLAKAGDNTSLFVVWDSNVQAWVTSDENASNPHLILDRSAQVGEANIPTESSNQYWTTYHPDSSQRTKVVWVHKLPNGVAIDSWLNANDYSKKWNSQLKKWESI